VITATLPVHKVDAQSLFDVVAHVTGEIVVLPSDEELADQLVVYMEPEDWTQEIVEALIEAAKWWLWSGDDRALRLVGPDRKFLMFTRGSRLGWYNVHHEHDGTHCEHCEGES